MFSAALGEEEARRQRLLSWAKWWSASSSAHQTRKKKHTKITLIILRICGEPVGAKGNEDGGEASGSEAQREGGGEVQLGSDDMEELLGQLQQRHGHLHERENI